MTEDAVVAPGRAILRLSTASGRIRVLGEVRDDIEVTVGDTRESTPGGDAVEVVITRTSASVAVRCPIGTDVVVGTASGQVVLGGHLGAARVTTASGSIEVASVESADLRAKSARIEVHECLGPCRVTTISGRVTIGRAGQIDVKGVSGRIEVSGDDVRVRTVSGRVRVDMARNALVETVSGTVEVRVPEGFRPRVTTHGLGPVRLEVPEGDDGEIAVRAISASVRVRSQ